MPSITRSHHAARAWLLGIVAVIAMVSLALLAACDISNPIEARRSGDQLSRTAVNQTAIANGLQIRLIDVSFSSDSTMLHMELNRGDAPVTAERFLPIRADQIEVENIGGDPANYGTSSFDPRPPDEGIIGMDLRVGPIVNANQDVVIRIASLLMRAEGREYSAVEGPWEFVLSAEDVVSVPVEQIIPINRTLEKNGIMVVVSEAQVSASGVVVTYHVPSLGEGGILPMESEVSIVLPDGRKFDGVSTTSRGGPATTEALRFPPLPDGVSSFALSFGSYVKSEQEPVEVTFAVPPTFYDASKRETTLIGETFFVDGESMRVEALQRGDAQVNGNDIEQITVAFENAEPDRLGTILMVGSSTVGRLIDNLGNEYASSGTYLGFHEDDAGNLFAGGSGLKFVGPLATGASTLTVIVDSYGRWVAGPDPITISVR